MSEETKVEEQQGGVEVELGGKKVVVNEQLAEALKLELQHRDDAFNQYKEQTKQELDARLGTFEQNLQQAQPKPQEQKPGFWDDPEGYISGALAEQAKKQEEKDAEREKQRASEAQAERLWGQFYQTHTEFDRKKDHFLVEAILNRDSAEFSKIYNNDGLEKAMDTLAERTQNYILDNIGKKKEKKEEVVLETQGSGTPFEMSPEQKDVKPEGTISNIIRQRSEKRRSGRVGKTA